MVAGFGRAYKKFFIVTRYIGWTKKRRQRLRGPEKLPVYRPKSRIDGESKTRK